jgi:hypothetical protein
MTDSKLLAPQHDSYRSHPFFVPGMQTRKQTGYFDRTSARAYIQSYVRGVKLLPPVDNWDNLPPPF